MENKKNKPSSTMVYKTIVAVLAKESFSLASKKKATADPPTLVGETAELNSQIKINSIHFLKLNSLSLREYNLNEYEIWCINKKTTAILNQNSVNPFHEIFLRSFHSTCFHTK